MSVTLVGIRKQAPTPDDLATAVLRLGRAGLALHHALSEFLGMHPTDLAALAHLAGDGPMTQERLRRRLGLQKGSMTALVDRLERAGHAAREPHPRDRRSTLLVASAGVGQGRAFGSGQLLEALAAVAGHRTAAERQVIASFLDDVVRVEETAAGRLSGGPRVVRTAPDSAPHQDGNAPTSTAGGNGR